MLLISFSSPKTVPNYIFSVVSQLCFIKTYSLFIKILLIFLALLESLMPAINVFFQIRKLRNEKTKKI